jgi:hypothetical protein
MQTHFASIQVHHFPLVIQNRGLYCYGLNQPKNLGHIQVLHDDVGQDEERDGAANSNNRA